MCVIMSMSVSTATIRSGMIDPPVTTFNINLTLENLKTKNNKGWLGVCVTVRVSVTIIVSQFGSAVKKALFVFVSDRSPRRNNVCVLGHESHALGLLKD